MAESAELSILGWAFVIVIFIIISVIIEKAVNNFLDGGSKKKDK